MTNIIESIGKWGVKTSRNPNRHNTPKPGDVVIYGNNEDLEHPYKGVDYGRIARIDDMDIKGIVSICVCGGSVFLNESGSVSISGGPFATVLIEDLIPTMGEQRVRFWNWGDLGSGAGNGVDYYLPRPVFRLKQQGEEAKIKIRELWDQAIVEEDARKEAALEVIEAQNEELRESTEPLIEKWQETTEEMYFDMLDVLPPERYESTVFMVGEPTTHGERGAVHSTYAKYKDNYYYRYDYLIDFDVRKYKKELDQQIGGK